jgi:hypothetical protein
VSVSPEKAIGIGNILSGVMSGTMPQKCLDDLNDVLRTSHNALPVHTETSPSTPYCTQDGIDADVTHHGDVHVDRGGADGETVRSQPEVEAATWQDTMIARYAQVNVHKLMCRQQQPSTHILRRDQTSTSWISS